MISDEVLKTKLLLAYKISSLYIKSGCSTADISRETEVPLATVKRAITTVGKRKDDYLRLLPDLATESQLILFQEAIDELVQYNKKINKWKPVTTLTNFKEDIKQIKELNVKGNLSIPDEKRKLVVNLRYEGLSVRAIAQETGYSLGTISGIINSYNNDAPKGKK